MFGMTPLDYRTNHIESEMLEQFNEMQSVDIQTILSKNKSIEIIERKFDSIGKRLLHV